MGAGTISNWMRQLPNLMIMKTDHLKDLLNEFGTTSNLNKI